MQVGLSLGVAGPNLSLNEALPFTITVDAEPSLAGIDPVAAGETYADILARMTNPGLASTDGPGPVTVTPMLSGGSNPVEAGQNLTLSILYTAPQAPPVSRIVGTLNVPEAQSGLASEAVQGNVTFPISGAQRAVGQYWDGAAYIVAPGGAQIDLAEPTPGFAAGRNGAMLNPIHQRPGDGAGADLAFDNRIPNYNSANGASFPAALQAGDIVTKAISTPMDLSGTDQRHGMFEEWAACHIVAAAPAPNTVSPAPFGWSGRGMPQGTPIDMARIAALKPNLPVGTQRVKSNLVSIIETRLDRFNPGLVASGSAGGGGYEYHALYRTGAFSGSTRNYGANIAQTYRMVLLAWMSDLTDATLPGIEAAIDKGLRHLVTVGCWLNQITAGRSLVAQGDGGHFEWTTIARMMALIAADRADEMATLISGDTNQMAQGFTFTQALLDRCVPHTNDNDPFTYRLRTVSAIAGNTITIDGNLGGEPFWLAFGGLQCRKADGTLIGVATLDGQIARASTIQVNLDTAAGLAVSDQVYFTPAYPIAVGDSGWTLERTGRFSTYTPSPQAVYMAINNWAAEALFVMAAGLNGDGRFDALIGHVQARLSLPGFPNPYGTVYQADIGDWVSDAWADWSPGLLPTEEITAVSTPGAARETWPVEASVGNAYATIPVTVTGTPGAAVQIRMVDTEFAGAGTQAWQALGPIGGGGTTTFDWHCAETRFWGELEVRIGTDDSTIQRQSKELAAGLVFVWGGQSEIENALINDFYGSAGDHPDAVAQDGNTRILYHEGGSTADEVITQANRVRTAHVAIANALAHYVPNAKCKVIITANAGDGLNELLDDSLGDWPWSRSDTVFQAGTLNGAMVPSVLLWHNLPSLSNLNTNFGPAMSEYLTGRRANGDVIVTPAAASHGGTTLDHTLRDWFGDYSRTRIVNCATRASDHYTNYQSQLRPSWESALSSIPHFGAAVAPAHHIEIAPIEWGRSAGGGTSWTDEAHPGLYTYGTRRWYTGLVEVTLAAYGLITRPDYVLDEVTYDAANNYVELGMSGQTITTSWIEAGDTPPAGMRAVVGFTFNGVTADATIVNGKIRVLKPGGGTVTHSDVIGLDTSSRMDARRILPNATNLADLQGDWFRGTPLVAHAGAALTQGVPLNLAATPAALFVNTIPVAGLPGTVHYDSDFATLPAGTYFETEPGVSFALNENGAGGGSTFRTSSGGTLILDVTNAWRDVGYSFDGADGAAHRLRILYNSDEGTSSKAIKLSVRATHSATHVTDGYWLYISLESGNLTLQQRDNNASTTLVSYTLPNGFFQGQVIDFGVDAAGIVTLDVQTTDGDPTLTRAITHDLGSSPAHATGKAILEYVSGAPNEEAYLQAVACYTP